MAIVCVTGKQAREIPCYVQNTVSGDTMLVTKNDNRKITWTYMKYSYLCVSHFERPPQSKVQSLTDLRVWGLCS